MGGIGPQPKDPSKRARRNAGPSNTVVQITPDSQPSLFEMFGVTNPATETDWHPATEKFWQQLGTYPTTAMMVGAQWTLLGVAVMLFDRVVSGKLGYAEEMRRELAAFGISPADLARLRISFALAEEVDPRPRPGASAARRYGELRAVDGDGRVSA